MQSRSLPEITGFSRNTDQRAYSGELRDEQPALLSRRSLSQRPLAASLLLLFDP